MSDTAGRIKKISVSIAGHSTSISLEQAFVEALHRVAGARKISVAALVAEIDAQRGPANLSSAIRVFLLHYFRAESTPAHPE